LFLGSKRTLFKGVNGKNGRGCVVIIEQRYEKEGDKIAIEIKGGPSKKAYLLSGSKRNEISVEFVESADKLKSELKEIYNHKAKHFYFDSQIGDIIKLTNLLYAGLFTAAYSIGLLLYTESGENEKSDYKKKLLELVKKVREHAEFFSWSYSDWDNDDLKVFITGIKISKHINEEGY